MRRKKCVVKEHKVLSEYSIYRGQLRDFVLDHWYNNWLFRVLTETYLNEYEDGSIAKRSYIADVEYCYALDKYTPKEHYSWIPVKNEGFAIDEKFLVCRRMIRHISEEEENKLFFDKEKERINYETI